MDNTTNNPADFDQNGDGEDMDWWEYQTSCYPEEDYEGDIYPRHHEDPYPEFDE